MQARHAAGVDEVEQEVAVGYGIERIRDGAAKAEHRSRGKAVERVGGAGQGRGAQRARIGDVSGRGEPVVVAGEHLHVGEHMVREEHRLGVLQMGIAGQDHLEIRLGLGDERLAQCHVGAHELASATLGVQARIRRHLVVARAAGVQPRTRVPDARRQLGLDGHVDVLALLHVEDEDPRFDVGLGDNALVGEHSRMGRRAGNILGIEPLINGQRRPEPLGEGVGAFGKSS